MHLFNNHCRLGGAEDSGEEEVEDEEESESDEKEVSVKPKVCTYIRKK